MQLPTRFKLSFILPPTPAIRLTFSPQTTHATLHFGARTSARQAAGCAELIWATFPADKMAMAFCFW